MDEEDIPIGSNGRPSGWRERRRLARQQREHDRRRRVYEQANARWEAENEELRQFLNLARTFRGGTSADAPLALQLRRGERAFYVVSNAALVEPRRAPGQWVGRSSGWSFRVARGVYYRVGASRGTYVPGQEQQTVVDYGTATITNQRATFQGGRQAREWQFAKLLGYADDPAWPVTILQVSNRQKASGIMYPGEHTPWFRFSLALALACYRRADGAFVAQVEAEFNAHQAARPAPLPPV
jgi:hypothetical protein